MQFNQLYKTHTDKARTSVLRTGMLYGADESASFFDLPIIGGYRQKLAGGYFQSNSVRVDEISQSLLG